jgi:hypothetical protein
MTTTLARLIEDKKSSIEWRKPTWRKLGELLLLFTTTASIIVGTLYPPLALLNTVFSMLYCIALWKDTQYSYEEILYPFTGLWFNIALTLLLVANIFVPSILLCALPILITGFIFVTDLKEYLRERREWLKHTKVKELLEAIDDEKSISRFASISNVQLMELVRDVDNKRDLTKIKNALLNKGVNLDDLLQECARARFFSNVYYTREILNVPIKLGAKAKDPFTLGKVLTDLPYICFNNQRETKILMETDSVLLNKYFNFKELYNQEAGHLYDKLKMRDLIKVLGYRPKDIDISVKNWALKTLCSYSNHFVRDEATSDMHKLIKAGADLSHISTIRDEERNQVLSRLVNQNDADVTAKLVNLPGFKVKVRLDASSYNYDEYVNIAKLDNLTVLFRHPDKLEHESDRAATKNYTHAFKHALQLRDRELAVLTASKAQLDIDDMQRSVNANPAWHEHYKWLLDDNDITCNELTKIELQRYFAHHDEIEYMDKAISKLDGTIHIYAVGEANSLATMKHALSGNLDQVCLYFVLRSLLVNKRPTCEIKERINELLKLGASFYYSNQAAESYSSIEYMAGLNHHNPELWSALLQTNMSTIEQADLDYALEKMVREQLKDDPNSVRSEQYIRQIALLVARGARFSDALTAQIVAHNDQDVSTHLQLLTTLPAVYDKIILELRASRDTVTAEILRKHNLPQDAEIINVLNARLDIANKFNEQLGNKVLSDIGAIIGEYLGVPSADVSNVSYKANSQQPEEKLTTRTHQI